MSTVLRRMPFTNMEKHLLDFLIRFSRVIITDKPDTMKTRLIAKA